MALSDIDGISTGLARTTSRRYTFIKNNIPNTAVGQEVSLWTAVSTSLPPAGANPTTWTILGASESANILNGAPAATPPEEMYLSNVVAINTGNASQDHILVDRLGHMGGLDGTSTSAQTVGADITGTSLNLVQRRGAANYSNVRWAVEWYADTGATSVNMTFNVTYDDASTGTVTLTGIGATIRRGRLLPILSAVNGRFIRAISDVTLSASTSAVGNFGVTAFRELTSVVSGATNIPVLYDWASLPITLLPAECCMTYHCFAASTTTGTPRIAHRIMYA